MEPEIEQMIATLRGKVPACIAEFPVDLVDTEFEESPSFKSVWRLACACGNNSGHVMGYSLHDYNPSYEGPEVFVSPLAFNCSVCGKETEIVDTDTHGYHSEVAKLEGGSGSANYRGNGPRKSYKCLACLADQLLVKVSFLYWPAAFDLFLDEPELPAQEFFNEFYLSGECVKCGAVSRITDFGKL